MTFSLLTVGNSVGYNNIRTHLTLTDLRSTTEEEEVRAGEASGSRELSQVLEHAHTKRDTLKQFHLHFSLRLDRGPEPGEDRPGQDRSEAVPAPFPVLCYHLVTS